MLKRRKRDEAALDGSVPSYESGSWGQTYPTLVEFLTSERWEDGERRRTGTVTLMAEDGVFKCSVRDRDGECFAFLSGRTPTELLAGLEKALLTDSLSWRRDQPLPGRNGKKG